MKTSMIVRIAAIVASVAIRAAVPGAAILSMGSGCAVGATFYVSPDGDDANPGSVDRPFATLEAARDAIRQMKMADKFPADGVTVYLRGGEDIGRVRSC